MTELSKAEQKKLGIRLPKQIKLYYVESDDSYHFEFSIKKVGKRSHK